MSWLYNRPTEGTLEYVEKKFAKRPEIAQANATAFKAGYAYGETSEDFAVSYEIAPAKMAPGVYRQISGNTAIAYGLIAASKLSGLDLFLGAYPDHARELDPRGAGAAQELRRPHLPGRGRDRRRRRCARRGLRRLARRHHLRRPGDRAQAGDDRARDHARAAAADPRHPARRPLDRDADEAGAGRPADGACSGATRRARCRCSPPRRRRSASTPRSRRRGSRSSTARPSTCSATPTSRTAPSRG